jgi:hypothetical protein
MTPNCYEVEALRIQAYGDGWNDRMLGQEKSKDNSNILYASYLTGWNEAGTVVLSQVIS